MATTFTYDYRASDVVTVNVSAIVYAVPLWVRAVGRLTPLVGAFLGLWAGAALVLQLGRYPVVASFPIAAFGFGGLVIASLLLGARAQSWMARRAPGLAPLEGKSVTFEFSDEGFWRRTENVQSFIRWAGVDCLLEKQGVVHLFVGGGVYFIPRRAMEDDNARRAFVDWALARLSPEAKARSRIAKPA